MAKGDYPELASPKCVTVHSGRGSSEVSRSQAKHCTMGHFLGKMGVLGSGVSWGRSKDSWKVGPDESQSNGGDKCWLKALALESMGQRELKKVSEKKGYRKPELH